MAGIIQVGQRVLSTGAIGGIAGAVYGAVEQNAGDYSADWRESASTGMKIGFGVGALGSYGAIKGLAKDGFNSASSAVMKTSTYTEAVGKGVSPQAAKFF